MSTLDQPRIKRLRRALRWPQHRMADYLGLTQAAVSNIEKGQDESGPVSKLLDMLEARIVDEGAAAVAAAIESPFPNEAVG